MNKKQMMVRWMVLGVAIISFILHNLIYGIFKIEEPVFFCLTLLAILAFFVLRIFDFFNRAKNKDLYANKNILEEVEQKK